MIGGLSASQSHGVVCLAAFLCLLAGAASGAAAARAAPQDPVVSVEPLVTYIQPGDLCTLQVAVGGADSLSCMEVFVAYDTAIVACTLGIEGSSFKTAGVPTFFRWEMVAADTATAVDCLLGYRTYFLAPGELVKFVFRGVRPGTSPVSITRVRLWDINRIELSPVAGGGADIVVRYATGGDPPLPENGVLWNFPNPFNPTTVLVLDAPPGAALSDASIDVIDPSGRRVKSLFRGALAAGRRELVWNGTDDEGAAVASGVYFAVAETARGTVVRKMILIR